MTSTSVTTALKLRAEVEFLKSKANLAEVLELKRARLRHTNGLLRQQRYEKLMSRRPADWPERVSVDEVGDEAEIHALLQERDKLTPLAKSTLALQEEVKRLKEDNEMQEALLDKLLSHATTSPAHLSRAETAKTMENSINPENRNSAQSATLAPQPEVRVDAKDVTLARHSSPTPNGSTADVRAALFQALEEAKRGSIPFHSPTERYMDVEMKSAPASPPATSPILSNSALHSRDPRVRAAAERSLNPPIASSSSAKLPNRDDLMQIDARVDVSSVPNNNQRAGSVPPSLLLPTAIMTRKRSYDEDTQESSLKKGKFSEASEALSVAFAEASSHTVDAYSFQAQRADMRKQIDSHASDETLGDKRRLVRKIMPDLYDDSSETFVDMIYSRLRVIGFKPRSNKDRRCHHVSPRFISAYFKAPNVMEANFVRLEEAEHGVARLMYIRAQQSIGGRVLPVFGTSGLCFRSGPDDPELPNEEHMEHVIAVGYSGKWEYKGRYKLRRSRALSPEEWSELPSRVRNEFLDAVRNAYCDVNMNTKITTLSDIFPAGLSKAKLQSLLRENERRMTEEIEARIEQGYSSGAVRLSVWTMEYREYNEHIGKWLANY